MMTLFPMIALTAAALFTPTERIADALLLIEDGIIADVTSRSRRPLPSNARLVDLGDAVLAPGLIDIHIPYPWRKWA
jgi:imidazolonepropionase-like amidohydrolase